MHVQWLANDPTFSADLLIHRLLMASSPEHSVGSEESSGKIDDAHDSSDAMDSDDAADKNAARPLAKPGRGHWTAEEVRLLKEGVALHGGKHWKLVAAHIGTRSALQAASRFHHTKGTAPQHLTMVSDAAEDAAENAEEKEAEHCIGKRSQSAMEEQTAAASPSERKAKKKRSSHWTPRELDLLAEGSAKYGNQWGKVAAHIGTRTAFQTVNRYSYCRKVAGWPTINKEPARSTTSSSSKDQLQQEPHESGDPVPPRKTQLWSTQEHALFLQGIEQHGASEQSWSKIAVLIGTRTAMQVSARHKYLQRLYAKKQRQEQEAAAAAAVPTEEGAAASSPVHFIADMLNTDPWDVEEL